MTFNSLSLLNSPWHNLNKVINAFRELNQNQLDPIDNIPYIERENASKICRPNWSGMIGNLRVAKNPGNN